MEHKEIRDLTNKLTGDEFLELMNTFLNGSGGTKLETAIIRNKALHDWHHTIQQCLMRSFIVPAVIALSEETYSDGRNEATVKMCKFLAPALKDTYYPFV